MVVGSTWKQKMVACFKAPH